MATMTATMTFQDSEIVALENAFWDALRTRDGARIARLTADDCTIVGASGVRAVTGPAIAKMLESAPYEIRSARIDPDTTRIVRFSEDCVAISYAVHEDVEIDGAKVQVDAFDASVWQRRDDAWQCVLHTESIAGDAFGRDRTAR